MRVEIPIVVTSNVGVPIANANANVYLRGTTNLAAVYQAAVGVAVHPNPMVTDAVGRLTGWLERGAYDVVISAPGLTTYTEPFEATPGSDAAIDTLWIADLSVTTAKLANEAVTAGKIAPGAITGSSGGLFSARPSAASVPNTFYYATDQAVLYFSLAGSWVRITPAVGQDLLWFSGTALPTGYVLLDGNNLPGSTGIYADLYAWNGSTLALPNTKGRVPVAVDAAQTEFDTVKETGGAKTHTLSHAELPPLKVNVGRTTGNGASAPVGGVGGDTAGDWTVTGTGGQALSGAAHNNLQPYITCYIAVHL